jgi:hypothetical protein
MRKLPALVVLGAGCAIGFPCLAVAADVVNIDCLVPSYPPSGNQGISIFSSQSSAGVEVPSSCTPNSPSCAQCEADLLSQGFTVNPYPVSITTAARTVTRFTFTRER